jgi:putative transposase
MMESKRSVKSLCGLFGKTKQAYYKQVSSSADKALEEAMVIEMVNKIRKRAKTKRWGGRKLHSLIKEELSGFSMKIGRDKLFDLLRENGMLVKSRKRRYYTTQSHHWLKKHENLIENIVISHPNQLWVSDITYVKFNKEVFYLYLITDAYSQKIVGFHVSIDLKANSAVKALRMALKDNKVKYAYKLIHHSDRGVQYCSEEYTGILIKHGILISMAKPASPQENAIAERVNGILKDEWLYDLELEQDENPYKKIKMIIEIYNQIRPHNSLKNLTPCQVHDLGFLRYKAERVIGKTYSYSRMAAPKKRQPENTDNYAIGPYDYSLASCSPAELASASSWHCKIEKNE